MKKNFSIGFTLVELLVVIAILGIISTIGLIAFNSAQMRGRDAARKSDLKQIANSLEVYYNDYGKYPNASGGQILGCPTTTATLCAWGTGQFTDTKTIYIKTVPKDPNSSFYYFYRTLNTGGGTNQGFQLYAQLENSQDTSACIGGNCGTHTDLPSGVVCGGSTGSCNFSITSPNTTPTTN